MNENKPIKICYKRWHNGEWLTYGNYKRMYQAIRVCKSLSKREFEVELRLEDENDTLAHEYYRAGELHIKMI